MFVVSTATHIRCPFLTLVFNLNLQKGGSSHFFNCLHFSERSLRREMAPCGCFTSHSAGFSTELCYLHRCVFSRTWTQTKRSMLPRKQGTQQLETTRQLGFIVNTDPIWETGSHWWVLIVVPDIKAQQMLLWCLYRLPFTCAEFRITHFSGRKAPDIIVVT